MTDDLLRALEDEPEHETDVLGAVEDHLRGICHLVANSSSRRSTKLSRDDLLLLLKDAETVRIMAAKGIEYPQAYQEAHDRYDEDPALGVRRAREYAEAWSRRSDERYDRERGSRHHGDARRPPEEL